MLRRLPVLIALVATLVFGTGIATAVVRSGDDTSAPAALTTTTVGSPTTTAPPPTTAATPTTVARATTTTRRVTTTRPPATTTVTVTVAPTTTRPALTRAAATQGLCSDIETAVRQVAGGNALGGGFRLVRAINTYGDAADPAVVAPARRMASTGVSGDLEASEAATLEAAGACNRLGFTVTLPGGVQCVTTPCP